MKKNNFINNNKLELSHNNYGKFLGKFNKMITFFLSVVNTTMNDK